MILGVVVARLGSTRLPAKALLPMGGSTMVGHAIDAMKNSAVDRTVLCTPDEVMPRFVTGDVLVWAKERDTTGELRNAAKIYGADHIVRVTADCPFVTSDIINCVIVEHLGFGAEYTYNHHDTLPSSTPEGIDVEVVTREGLRRLMGKEHLYNGEDVTIHCVDMEEERGVFSVDTLDEYIKAYKEI